MSKMSKSTHMGFYITYGKNKTFELPVNPAEVSIKYETDDKQTNIISYGEINQIGEYKLRNFDFDFVLPRHMKVTHYLTANKLKSRAQDYLSLLIKLYKAKKPIRFVISSTAVSIKMTIARFTFGFKDGYADEYACTLSLREYRSYAAKRVKPKKKKKKSAKKGKTRSKSVVKVSRGSIVVATGSLYSTAVGGTKLNATVKNRTVKVMLISPNAKYPYYIQTLTNQPLGWISKANVRGS